MIRLFKLGLQNVLSALLRSSLTVLGLAIGVAAILAVLTLGEAGKDQVKSEIGRLGVDRVRITSADMNNGLHTDDGDYLRMLLHTQIDELVCLEGRLHKGEDVFVAPLIGCSTDYLRQMDPVLIKGTIPKQWHTAAPVALVGESIAEILNLKVGEWFSANGAMMLCAGIIGTSQQATQLDTSKAVTVPKDLLLAYTGGMISEMSVLVPQDRAPDSVAAFAAEMLAKERSVKVNAISLQVQADAAQSVLNTFVDVLGWVAVICMTVAGIGVMNILLVSVRERRREIGIMQALGANGMQICCLFLCEAFIYGLAGGILGLLIGGVVVAVAGASMGLSPVIRAGDCTVVFLAAMLLGLAAGGLPAIRASMLKPVDALRDD